MKQNNNNPNAESPQASLEMKIIDEYLKEKGFSSIKDLCRLPENDAKQLMIEA